MAVYQGNVGEAPAGLPWGSTSGNGDAADQTQGSMLSPGVTTSSPLGDPDSSNPPGGPGTGFSNPDTQQQGGGNGESIGMFSAGGQDGASGDPTGVGPTGFTNPDGTVSHPPPPTMVGDVGGNTSAAAGRAQATLGSTTPRQTFAGQNAPGFFGTVWDWFSSTSLSQKLDPSNPTPVSIDNGVTASGVPLDSSGKARPAANYQTPSMGMPTWEKALIAAGLLAAGLVVIFGLKETKGLVQAVKA
jgi:hypothetical protein